MKLAEALAERSDCQNRIEEIKKRLIRSARMQEGEQPAEDTTQLLAETERTFARLLELVRQSTAPTRRLRSITSVLFLMQLPNVTWSASVAISSQESQTPQSPGRIVTRSRRCDSLQPCRSESCRRKWISSQSGIARWIHGCRN